MTATDLNGTNSAILKLSEAADLIRVSEKTLGEMARQNRVPCQKVGREWRFLRTALEDWLKGGESSEHLSNIEDKEITQTGLGLKAEQVKLFEETGFRDTAFNQNKYEPLHRWVPWIAGFSSSFVDGVFDKILGKKNGEITILDPFAGVGTTLIEGFKRGYNVIGFEINPYAALACRIKLESYQYDTKVLDQKIKAFIKFMAQKLPSNEYPQSRTPMNFKSRDPFFSGEVERQVLFCIDFISGQKDAWVKDIFRLALGAVMVGFSNYSYEPSLGRRTSAGKKQITNADVPQILSEKVLEFKEDIVLSKRLIFSLKKVPAFKVIKESYLESANRVPVKSVDLLVTSPPYLNNYHYIRNTRPQLYWLGLNGSAEDSKNLENHSFGKFWQTVRSLPEINLEVEIRDLRKIIEGLRATNKERGSYGGWGWANYAATYFNDCARFCAQTKKLMKNGSSVVVVIGNNILQGIEIKTDVFFAKIAEQLGFEVVNIHKVRTKRTGSSIVNSSVRVGSASQRAELYESAVELTLRR